MSADEIAVEEVRLGRNAAIGKQVLAVPATIATIRRGRRGVDSITMLAARFCADINTQGCLCGPAADMIWHMSFLDDPAVQAAVVLGGSVGNDLLAQLCRFGFNGLARLFRRGGRLLTPLERENLRERALGTAAPRDGYSKILEEYDNSD